MRRALLFFTILGTTACAYVRPPDPQASALYRDLERLVTLTHSAGWDLDRVELEGMLPDALQSFCQVEPHKREALLDWIDLRIAELGGPVESAYVERGRDLDEVSELLEVTRIGMVLRRSFASSSECPFWLEPDPEFNGEQLADDRFLLSLAGGGKGMLVAQGGRADLNFGGAGRVLFGRGFGAHWTLFTGVELGAVASFPRQGEGRGNLVLGLDAVVPLVVRYRFVNFYVEAEGGYLARGTEERRTPESGIHVGLAGGVQASKRLWAIPGVGFAATYERTFPGDGLPALHMVKVGARVGIDIGL
ncbi:hypothetical protein L6R52_06000 [Myxococcota bacterium]|nr:hypothetical protein [Myxococcota bacterium]